MKVSYSEGRRSRHGFMNFGRLEEGEEVYWGQLCIRSVRRMPSRKTIERRVAKMNLKKGSVITVPNWYVGYADLVIEV